MNKSAAAHHRNDSPNACGCLILSYIPEHDYNSIIIFTQNGLDVFSTSGQFLSHYDAREGEPMLPPGIWRLGTEGGASQAGIRNGRYIKLSPCSISA